MAPVQQVRQRQQAVPVQVAQTARREYVIRVEQGRSLDPAIQAGFSVVARSSLSSLNVDVARLRATRGGSNRAILDRLRIALPGAVVDRNTLYRTSALECTASNCPKFAMVDWPLPPGSCQIKAVIGMIDTGVQSEHPALKGRSITTLSSRSADRRASSDRHGTAVAALLVGDALQSNAGNNHAGLLPAADLVAVDAFHRNSEGTDTADSYDVVRAIDILVERRVSVINMSIAGEDNEVVRDIVFAVTGKGTVLVAAAGNGGPQAPSAYPAAYEPVIAVTALDKDKKLFRRANRGDYIDFAAPGVDLRLADTRQAAGRTQSGTSFAAPFATAIMAAHMNGSTKLEGKPEDALRKSVVDLGAQGRDREFGWGLLQATDICR